MHVFNIAKRAIAVCLTAGAVFAAADSHAADPPDASPVLAELFTSQGCSSCPPAERFFAELADEPGVVAIEWHVDYWDDLIHGGSRWKDPFSSPDFTARQGRYNIMLRGTSGVYTPQAVIQGAHETTGSRRAEVRAAVDAAPRGSARIAFEDAGEDFAIKLSGEGGGRVFLVSLLEHRETQVTGGENKGRHLTSRNIVRSVHDLGAWTGGAASFDPPALEPGEGCAVFIQSGSPARPGPVLAARYCP